MIRAVAEKLLPNGQVRIHWIIRREDGPASPIQTKKGPMDAPVHPAFGGWNGGKWFAACRPGVVMETKLGRDGLAHVPHRTDEPTAATCPECKATKEYQAAIAGLKKEE